MRNILLLFLLQVSLLFSSVDLEEQAQSFVLETRQLHIPGHPHAFNPSIARWRGGLLMSFREVNPLPLPGLRALSYMANSRLGLIWLDEDFRPLGPPQLLDLNKNDPDRRVHYRAEEARLIVVADHLYLVYSDNRELEYRQGAVRVYLSEVSWDGENFSLLSTNCLSEFEGNHPERREKNWVPFLYQDKLYLAYSLFPHRIFFPYPETNYCETVAFTQSDIEWNLGELRGGTPALPLDDKLNLSFFHSCLDMPSLHSRDVPILHYFMGAYTFSREPPFTITSISPEPIIGINFYQGAQYVPYWKPVCVVFPCGFIFEGDYIWLSYGRQDHEIWIAKIDRQQLLNSLVSVTH